MPGVVPRAVVIVAAAISLAASSARAADAVAAKISGDAVLPIDRQGYPDTVRAWGAKWIRRINDLMPGAARKVAESPECDRVEIVGLSDQRSVPRKTIVFFVDCRNKKRFYLSEDDIKGTGVVVSLSAKTGAISDSAAVSACEQRVRDQLKYPLSFKRWWTETSVHRATGGNVAVDFVFEARNVLGATLPQRARCFVDDRGMSEAQIMQK